MSGLSKAEEARRLDAYKKTSSDPEAAKSLGMSTVRFYVWRESRGLPSKTRLRWKERDKAWLKAYRRTRSDAEAARLLGAVMSNFHVWRRSRGLPPKGKKARILTNTPDPRWLRVYKKARSDAEAAAVLGVTYERFLNWRHLHGLPPQRKRKEDARRLAAYKKTQSDEEAARLLRIPPKAFEKWRHMQGRPSKKTARRAREKKKEAARRLRAYHATMSDKEAARKLDMRPVTFYAWRRKEGLPAKWRRPSR